MICGSIQEHLYPEVFPSQECWSSQEPSGKNCSLHIWNPQYIVSLAHPVFIAIILILELVRAQAFQNEEQTKNHATAV